MLKCLSGQKKKLRDPATGYLMKGLENAIMIFLKTDRYLV